MNRFLIFSAGDCELAIDVAGVREVVPAATLAPAVQSASELEGLLNLRGSVVPVISLEKHLVISQPEMSASDFLIIVADKQGRRFAIRANNEVQFTQDDEAVKERSSGSDGEQTCSLIRIGDRIATVLSVDGLSPHTASTTGKESIGGSET